MSSTLHVAHLETGMKLYGGAYQVMLLLGALEQQGIKNSLICVKGSAIGAAAEQAGYAVHYLSQAGDLRFQMIGELRAIFKATQPDLVHLHSRRGADVIGAIAAKLSKLPCVLSRRVDNPEGRFARLKYRLYDHVITISDAIADVLQHAGVKADRITTVRSALDSDTFAHAFDQARFDALLGLHKERRVIATLAQLIPRKGHELLIQAAPAVIAKHPDVLFVFFGQGQQHQALCQQIIDQQLQDHFLLPGFVEGIESILAGCYAVAHPAYREGLGISLLQAQAAGVPVITSETGGMKEAIHAPYTGWFVPVGDASALAKKLNLLLAKPSLRNQMGHTGQVWIKENFSVEKMAQGNAAIYRKLCPALQHTG